MKNLVINTQYMENYGDKENPYMKFKGGNTFILPNCGDLDENEVATLVARVRPFITTTLEESNGGCEEYIIDFDVVKKSDIHVPTWETITEFHFLNEDGSPSFLKVTDNREDGWMRSEILEKTEAWKMLPNSERQDYAASYLMRDGDICESQKDLENWFDTCGQVEVV